MQASFEENFSEDWLDEAKALAGRPTLDLRANTLKSTRDKVLKALERSGAEAATIARNGIRIPAGEGASRLPNVTAELSFQKGWFEVQDEGSQIVADLAFPQEGEQVLDYCAGGGGKTLAMSAAMNNKGQVHAYDTDRKRLAPIIERLKRAGTRNVQVHDSADSAGAACRPFRSGSRRCALHRHRNVASPPRHQVAAQPEEPRRAHLPAGRSAGKCCAVRAAGRTPDLRHLLGASARRTRRRSTASAEDNPEFEILSAADIWAGLFGTDKPQPWSADMKTVTLTPASTGTDGFFFCLMQRKA